MARSVYHFPDIKCRFIYRSISYVFSTFQSTLEIAIGLFTEHKYVVYCEPRWRFLAPSHLWSGAGKWPTDASVTSTLMFRAIFHKERYHGTALKWRAVLYKYPLIIYVDEFASRSMLFSRGSSGGCCSRPVGRRDKTYGSSGTII